MLYTDTEHTTTYYYNCHDPIQLEVIVGEMQTGEFAPLRWVAIQLPAFIISQERLGGTF
jgi:hypothetical protein